ncbi:MAG: SPFH domain-containing protein [Clostridiales bacterium]|jgi:membrane protease subunit (stomatin/prohibitin family)|nr:SPFH domain-containing protein [Clostridiales bacterium]
MGLIKAIIGAAGGALADSWRDYFYCESMPADILVSKGQKRASKRSSNTRGEDNVISNGSVIAVNDGQCMIIVDQGKVVEVCAEPGQFTYDQSTEPSIFYGSLGEEIKKTFASIGQRFSFGGGAGKDQRVYYFNTKEIVGNKYGTVNPVPFRVVDRNIGLDIDIGIRCNGEYSYKIVDPILFYTNVCGNVSSVYNRSQIDSQLKSELLTALQPAFAKISEMGVRYSALPGHTMEIANALNDVLSANWRQMRGVSIASFGVNSVTASKEDEDMIKQLQKNAVMRDPSMAGANLAGAQADAMKMAASNQAGAMTGFMGMNMAQQTGGMNAHDLFAMGQAASERTLSERAAPEQRISGNAAAEWACSCGARNTGNFCRECGKPKPQANSWTCSCGAVNAGKFCAECGQPRPRSAAVCGKCGWKIPDSAAPPKFCPECGNNLRESS